MYTITLDFIGGGDSDTKKVIITCAENDEYNNNNIFSTIKNETKIYVNQVTVGPCCNESILRDLTKIHIDKARDYVMRRRIHNGERFSITI